MEETFPLPVPRHPPGRVGTSRAQHWSCPQTESASHSTGTGREGEVCQRLTRALPSPPAAAAGGAGDGPLFLPAAPGRATRPGLRGAKHIGMQSTAPAMEVKFRGGGWIWPQTCPWCSRTAAWGWGQALPPCSYQLSQWLLWKTQGCTESCFQLLLWTRGGGVSPATPTVELVSYSHGELASLELWQKEERKKKKRSRRTVSPSIKVAKISN